VRCCLARDGSAQMQIAAKKLIVFADSDAASDALKAL
jgi:hypothetical protein